MSIDIPIIFIISGFSFFCIFILFTIIKVNIKKNKYKKENKECYLIENSNSKKTLLFWILMNSLGLAGTYKFIDYIVINPINTAFSTDENSYIFIGTIMLTVILFEQIYKECKKYYISSMECVRPGY